jgi:microcystin-dependent protein
MLRFTAAVGGIAALTAAAFTVGRSSAAGIPASSALTYSGSLQAANGTPLTGSHTLEVRFWSASSGGSTLCTSGEQANVALNSGRFSLALPDECTEAVKGNAEAYVEVVLDQSSLGRAKAGAVPYAVEAAQAVLASDATKSGALDQRLSTLEAALKNLIPPGTIIAFAGEQAPAGWLLCDGRAVSRSMYAGLFAALSIKWGAGDGTTTFNLPDLRGRTLIGAGQGTGLSERLLGQALGAEKHTLTLAEMPSHSHSLRTIPPDDPSPGGYSGGGWAGDAMTLETSRAGGDQPHNNMQPSAVASYIIRY